MGWEWAIYLALIAMASERKKQAFETGAKRQDEIFDWLSESRKRKSELNEEESEELLGKLGKGKVTADQATESARINALMDKMGSDAPTSDKLVAGGSPKIIKDTLTQALKDMSANVKQRGSSKAKLDSLTNSFDKYTGDFMDANTLASQLASELKGESAVGEIGLKEASNTYDQPGDILGQLADLYGTYMMFSGGGDDPTVVGDSPAVELTPTKRQGGDIYKYAQHV